MAGAEDAVHGMREIFEKEETDAVPLIHASNAFNRLNRKVAMRITCPKVSLYIINMYRHPSRLFINDGAIPRYAVNTRSLIDRLRITVITVPEVK